MFDKISEELKQARENASLTLQQIATKTRIDLKFLENLEKGNFTFMPELYIKAFIRDYSKVVGLDETLMMKKYESAKKGQTFEENPAVISDEENKAKVSGSESATRGNVYSSLPYTSEEELARQQENAKQYKRKMIIASSVAGALVLFVIIYFAFIKGSSDIIVTEKPISEVIKENEKQYDLNKPKPAAADSTFVSAPSDSLSLLIVADDTSWIKIILDGKGENTFTLFPNSKKILKTKSSYQLTIGNAAAIKLALDNKPLNFSGGKHEVKEVLIDSTGLKYLSLSQTQTQK